MSLDLEIAASRGQFDKVKRLCKHTNIHANNEEA